MKCPRTTHRCLYASRTKVQQWAIYHGTRDLRVHEEVCRVEDHLSSNGFRETRSFQFEYRVEFPDQNNVALGGKSLKASSLCTLLTTQCMEDGILRSQRTVKEAGWCWIPMKSLVSTGVACWSPGNSLSLFASKSPRGRRRTGEKVAW